MMYPFCKYPDETEVVFSDIRKKENGEEFMIVCFERPTDKGLDTIIFELPSYNILEKSGHYTDEEIEGFREIVERGAHLFFKYARNGGLKFT